MLNHHGILLLSATLLLSACGSSSPQSVENVAAVVPAVVPKIAPKIAPKIVPSAPATPLLHLQPEHDIYLTDGDFVHNASAQQFIHHMVHQHGFNQQQLTDIFSRARRLDYVINLMDRQAPAPASAAKVQKPNGAWLRYRKNFITTENLQRGAQFWDQYQQALTRAEQYYGVPAQIIVGIIGVETRWGRITGKTRVLDALATLAFNYPRRASYFSKELETYLLMSRKEGTDPLGATGSFAGAMGYGQFMPTSYQQYAVDFNGDGHINLWDPVDAIGSVAHYFQQHGWIANEQVAIPATGKTVTLEDGFNTRYTPAQLSQAGLTPLSAVNHRQVSLLRLDMGSHYQYWYGLTNFYVITRYNHSTYYAMAVWQLGQQIADARKKRPLTSQ